LFVVPYGSLSWLAISFWANVNLSYRTVTVKQVVSKYRRHLTYRACVWNLEHHSLI